MFFSLLSQAQIVQTYRQGFEATGETYSYNMAQGTAAPVTSVQYTGNRALKISHTGTDAYLYLDTIDFTANSSFNYFNLEFGHICDVVPTECLSGSSVAIVEVRRVESNDWVQLSGSTHYDRSDSYSSDFTGTSSFSSRSYNEWRSAQGVTNGLWKKERFRLDNIFTGVPVANRKLLVRFVLKKNNVNPNSSKGWYIDEISLTASTQSMTNPKLTLINWPQENMPYPTSRSTRVEAEVTTTVPNGIEADSVYLLYRLGSSNSAPVQKQTMAVLSQETNNQGGITKMKVRATIPFIGYDTIIRYRIVAKDATNNRNAVTFPSAADTWASYHCTRGYYMQASTNTGTLGNSSDFPFPGSASHKSQFIYDSASLAQAGYRSGSITGLKLMTNSSVNHSQRPHFVVKMCNIPSSYQLDQAQVNEGNPFFDLQSMKVVYDSSLEITQNANTVMQIDFQDTFFYAGKGILMQVYAATGVNGNWYNPSGMSVKTCATATLCNTLYQSTDAINQQDPLNSSQFQRGNASNQHPDFIFKCFENVPLLVDCGISGYVTPNDTVSANAGQNNNVTLTLKNYGVNTINGVDIYYSVDGGASHYYRWTGNLAGGATTSVTVNTTQQFTAGYHEMLAWVGDSITCGTNVYIDHEPLNDTMWTRMISCAGPMSGNVQIGGTGASYADMEQFLYAVSICGVGGPLHVKLAPGTYAPMVVPSIPGASAVNYVQFEPLNGSATSVNFATNEISNANAPIILADLRSAHHIRFSKINFVTTYANNITHPVRLSMNSVGCQFDGCTFREEQSQSGNLALSTRATALLYSGGADSLVVNNCSFSRGNIGISMVGPAADNLAKGAVITRNSFANQGTNAIVVRNHIASIVDSNSMNNVLSSSNYLMLFQDCHQAMRVTRNTAFVTTGSACIGVTNFYGTPSAQAYIANNMFVCADDGTANALTTPMFIISAEYTQIVYNSVKMTAPAHAGIAAATLGGGEIDHCYFYNNIVSCFDTTNYAFSYVPFTGNVNYIGNNIYYSASYLLNKYDGVSCNNISAWNTHISDGNSQQVNPAFLNNTPTDLRSYSQNVKNHGVPIAGITDDIYGTPRSATATCIGAFEFSSLPYDFEIVGLVEPYEEYCNVPSGAPLRVLIKNHGINDFVPGTTGNLTLTYSRTATPGVMAPGNSGNLTVTNTIPGNSTVECQFSANLHFPTNGTRDTTYTFTLWLTSTTDVNHVNDTSAYHVTARNHPAAPTAVNMNTNYATAATVNVTGGIDTWYSNIYTSGRTEKSTIYWYADTNAATMPFHRGNSYTTDTLFEDTTFYVRQKRELGLMKITSVQTKKNGVGVTYPQPMWMNTATDFAVELTNVGDYPATMDGDTLMLISVKNDNTPNTTLNNKYFIFNNATVQPGESIVIQFKSGTTTPDSNITQAGINLTPGYNANYAILYRDKKGVVDAVSFNNMTSASGTVWTSNNIHNTVWNGPGIAMNNTTAGVYRTSFPTTTGSPVNSANFWQVADSTHIMSIGTSKAHFRRFFDNGCIGDWAPVNIHLLNVPNVDLSIASGDVPEGCGLGFEPYTVQVNNYGAGASGPVAIHLDVNGTLVCTDTIADVAARGSVQHTFSQPINMSVVNGCQDFVLKAYVDHLTADNTIFNDSIQVTANSCYTPGAPIVQTYDTVEYAGTLLLSTITPSADSLRWYDRHMNVVARVNNYQTPHLFNDDTFYVAALAPSPTYIHVGQLASTNNATAYPSPFNPNKLNGQEQYLFKAEELIAAGHQAGPITALSFYLDTILFNQGTMTYANYKVSIGSTSIQAFNNGNASTKWQPNLTEVFNQQNLTLTNTNRGWVRFNFSTPFIWDGTSNIVVDVVRQMNAAITQGAKTRYTAAFTGAVYYKDDANAATLTSNPDNGALSANRPDILFTFQDFGCEGPVSPVYIHVDGTPSIDGSVTWPAEYDTLAFSSCGNTNVDVMLHNRGTDTIADMQLDYWVDGVHGVTNVTTPMAGSDSARVTVATPALTPGRHTLRVAVTIANDTVSVNDTIFRMINVSFCAGNYTIGAAATCDYPTFQVALDTLYGAGIAGPVVFNVQSGTYTEKLNIAAINGTNQTNTITFRAASGNAEDVTLTCDTINATRNYVVRIDGASDIIFKQMRIFANGPAASSNAVELNNCANIHFDSAIVEVKAANNNINSSCIIVKPGVVGLYIENSRVLNGYYSVRGMCGIAGQTSGMYFSNSEFRNFWSQGIFLRKIEDVYVRHNVIRSGVTVSGRALTGLYVAEASAVDIERNDIVLFDNMNGGKRPLVISNCQGDNIDRIKVYNNICLANSTGTSGQVPQGITLDSSVYVNVYYNTVKVYAGANSASTRAFSVDHNSSAVNVLNNIFANFSRGYAYWLFNISNVAQSNYNVLYSDTSAIVVNKKLARVGTSDLPTLDTLRMTTGKEANSLFSQPYFEAADDLHLAFGLYNEQAQYLPDVTNDIDGTSRPAIPGPCIGAHEYVRCYHNVAIMQFMEPTLETNPYPVEADTMRVIVKLFNDGTSTETNLWWRANIVGHPNLTTPNNVIDEIAPHEIVYATSYIVLPMGLIDTQHVEAFFSTDLPNDTNLNNNVADTVFFIDMAYDLTVTGNDAINITTDVGYGEGCRLSAAPIAITVTNKGRKPVPVNYPITIGYEVKLPANANYTVSQIPAVHEEQVYLTAPLGVNEGVALQFATPINIYPTGNSKDISVKVRGWAHYQYDQKPVGANSKDTSAVYNNLNSWKSYTSKYTPREPQGVDLHINYATWDTLRATQSEIYPGTSAGRPILWYRDSTDQEPFHSPSQYARSCWWETPQYYHDSTYYLACVSATGCTSYYNPIHVYVNPRNPVDMAVMGETVGRDDLAGLRTVQEPYSKVFMNNDTVKVRLINYGSQTQTNIPVTYQLRGGTGLNQPVLQEVTEICHASIQPDSVYLFKFDSLVNIPFRNDTYYTLRVWTDLQNDAVHANDTIRELYQFRAKSENAYVVPEVGSPTGLDITHFSFADLCVDVPEVGRDYYNFGSYDNPDFAPLRMIKGTTDTMIIEVANSDDHSDYNMSGYITVMVDFNRDGYFDNTTLEAAQYGLYTEIIFADTISSRHPRKFEYRLPTDICLGYMRMRVVVEQGGNSSIEYQLTGNPTAMRPSIDFGTVHDYLLYIEDDPEEADLALSRLVSPRSTTLWASRDVDPATDSTHISVLISNKGKTTITSAEVFYKISHNGVTTESVTWNGNLEPGRSTVVDLPARYLDEGTHTYIMWVNTMGDTNTTNDTLRVQFHRFQTKTLILSDDFETDRIKWYAPTGFNQFTHNYWEIGQSNKPRLSNAVSDSSVMTTNLNGLVTSGARGNLSYIYTPVIDISQIRPDTINFWMASNLGDSTVAYLEFYDYQGKWQKVGSGNDSAWYTGGPGFVGTSSGYTFNQYSFSTSRISGDFQSRLQFRWVFHSRPGAPACDGISIDDFRIGRAQRQVDVGVIAIVHPTHPKFGQTIRPKVAIQNFGWDTIRSVSVAYRPYGSNLPKFGTYEGAIPPGEAKLYEFPDGFIVMADFPDTFDICAFTTVNMDIYWENDSTCKNFALSPLDNDMGMVEFLSPLDRIVAGDSIEVTARLRNYGAEPVSSMSVSYSMNGRVVTENVDFNAHLGRDLNSFEYFNYTFHQKIRATMGIMHLEAYCQMENDDYPYNDTIRKTVDGISAIYDLKARSVIVDTTYTFERKIQLIVDNVGALAVSDFDIGFWIDNDTSTLYMQHVHCDPPLASLSSKYIHFDTSLPVRQAPNGYFYVNAFVVCPGDNDRSNDSTNVIETQYFDMVAHRVEVEENREDDCRVRIELENIGNIALYRSNGFTVRAVINGVSISQVCTDRVAPGERVHVMFDQKIPKSPNRTYIGTGEYAKPVDAVPANNQTSVVEIVNYFDGIPVVDKGDGISLDQNYPNPFNDETRIDFYIPESNKVRFFVMDLMGRLVYQSEGDYTSGNNSIVFSSKSLSTGVYHYGIEVDGHRLIRKMIIK